MNNFVFKSWLIKIYNNNKPNELHSYLCDDNCFKIRFLKNAGVFDLVNQWNFEIDLDKCEWDV
jgi:hypothetical protein